MPMHHAHAMHVLMPMCPCMCSCPCAHARAQAAARALSNLVVNSEANKVEVVKFGAIHSLVGRVGLPRTATLAGRPAGRPRLLLLSSRCPPAFQA